MSKKSQQVKEDKVFALSLVDASRINDPVDKIITDFQIERYELPIGLARTIACMLIAFLLALILWAAIAQIDVVARAPGQLRPYGKPKLVQAELNGKIRRIAVREGSHVKQNDLLVELDSSIYKNELDERLLSVEQEKIKLRQMEEGKNALIAILKTPDVLPVVIADIGNVSQVIDDIYSARKILEEADYDVRSRNDQQLGQPAGEMTDLEGMLRQLEIERDQKTKQVALLREQYQKEEAQRKTRIAALRQQIAMRKQGLDELRYVQKLSREQEADYAQVLDLGVSRVQFLDIKQKVGESNKRVLDESAAISSLQTELDLAALDLPRWKLQIEADILRIQNEINVVITNAKDVQIRMRNTTRDLAQAQAKFNMAIEKGKTALSSQIDQISAQNDAVKERQAAAEEASHFLGKSMIKAPMSGSVTGLIVRAPGEVVATGEVLMQILPDRGEIVIEATVSDADIAFVRLGQNVKLKMDAFPYQDFGIIEGTVYEIEQYPELDQKRGYVYLVRVRPKQMEMLVRGKKIFLKEGLTGECNIILRKLTVLQALLRPVARLSYLNMKE